MAVFGKTGADDYLLGKCVDGAPSYSVPQGAVTGSFDRVTSMLRFNATSQGVGGARFRFNVIASWTNSSGTTYYDYAPDEGTWDFPPGASPPPPPPPGSWAPPPAPPDAQRCVVPKLAGRTVRGAGTALGRANCRLGAVKRALSSRRKRGRIMASHRARVPSSAPERA